jgi:pimeloyl-ACP methyl ester carboxylesterase
MNQVSTAVDTRDERCSALCRSSAVTEPAWKSKPSWYLVSTEDKMIPPDAQRAMSKRAGATVTEVKGSHAVYVSQPKAVATLIAKAATSVALTSQ